MNISETGNAKNIADSHPTHLLPHSQHKCRNEHLQCKIQPISSCSLLAYFNTVFTAFYFHQGVTRCQTLYSQTLLILSCVLLFCTWQDRKGRVNQKVYLQLILRGSSNITYVRGKKVFHFSWSSNSLSCPKWILRLIKFSKLATDSCYGTFCNKDFV